MRRWSSAASSRRTTACDCWARALRASIRRRTSRWLGSCATWPNWPWRIAPPTDRPGGTSDVRWLLRVGPLLELGATLEARDERIARLCAVVHHHVPQPLRVDQEATAAMQRHTHLGPGVGQAVGPV